MYQFIYKDQPVSSGGVNFETDDTLILSDDILSVAPKSRPRGVTKAEFDAMTEEEKQGYIVVTDENDSIDFVIVDGEVYSTEETMIGIWIDGKPLYRKAFVSVIPEQTGITADIIDLTPLNLDTVTYTGGSASKRSLPLIANNISLAAWVNIEKTGLNFYASSNTFAGQSLIIVLEYTKTTDAPNQTRVLPTNYVTEYDTDNAWHVRKYSDGYVEMIKEVDDLLVPVSSWAEWGTDNLKIFRSGYIINKETLPLKLVKKYSESPVVSKSSMGFNFFWNIGSSGSLEYNNPYRFLTMGVPASDVTVSASLTVTGRWK